MTLRILVDGERFNVPLRGFADQCGIFASYASDEVTDDDLSSLMSDEIEINVCTCDVFRAFLCYLGRRAGAPPRPIVAPLTSFDFRSNVDQIDAEFVELVVFREDQPFLKGATTLIQLLSLAAFMQHNHLRQVCATYIVCSACGSSDDQIRARFGLSPLNLDQRQVVLDELHFFVRAS